MQTLSIRKGEKKQNNTKQCNEKHPQKEGKKKKRKQLLTIPRIKDIEYTDFE